jgi:hypothetical protein
VSSDYAAKKIIIHIFICWSWDSAVDIATGYELDEKRGRSSSPDRFKNFLFSMSSRPVLGSTQPPNQWVPGVLSPGVKRPWREAEHSPPTIAEVKKNINLYNDSPMRLHSVALY